MRAWVVTPAQVHAQPVGGDVAHGVVQRLDVHGDALAERVAIEPGVGRVPAHGQIGAVELHEGAGGGDGLVLVAHRLGHCEQVLLVGSVVLIAEEQGDDAG
jgi:hypothetical protein